MNNVVRLVVLSRAVHAARTPLARMRTLYELRQFLVELDNVTMLHVDVEVNLHDLESKLSETDKQVMRNMGYQFPEDLDKPREWLCE